MSDQDQQQQQQQEPNYDHQGNVVRGRAGNLMGMDRGPQRGGVFESLDPRAFEASPQGASSSVQGWVMMISNLSPNTTQNDLEMFLSDVDPTTSMLDDNNNNGEENNNTNDPTLQGQKFICDVRMNMSAENVCCLGHAFVKTPKLEWAHLIQTLNGRPFVDDMEVEVDFAFKVPSNNNNNNDDDNNKFSGAVRDRVEGNGDDGVGPSQPSQQEN